MHSLTRRTPLAPDNPNSPIHPPTALRLHPKSTACREFAKLGLTRSVGGVLGLALSRELTPVVTCIIVAGRVGSAFAAELGTMQARALSRGYGG